MPGAIRRWPSRCPTASERCSSRPWGSRTRRQRNSRPSRCGCARPRCRHADRDGLAAIVGADYCSVDDRGRLLRAGGKSTLDLLRRKDSGVQDAPDAVLLPGDDDDVAAILQYCASRSIAVVPFGGGTSVVGGLDPIRGDFKAVISLDLRRLERTARTRRDLRRSRTGRRTDGTRGRAPARRARLCYRPFPAELSVRHHRRIRRDPVVGSRFCWLRTVQRHGPWAADGDARRRARPGSGAGVGRRTGSSTADDRLRRRVRDHHPRADQGAPRPRGHPLRSVVLSRLRHRRRRTARGRPDGHWPDGDPAVRRGRDRRQPRHHGTHRRAESHRRLPGDHGLRGHRGARGEPPRRNPRADGSARRHVVGRSSRPAPGSTAGSVRHTFGIHCCRRGRCARRWRQPPIGRTSAR